MNLPTHDEIQDARDNARLDAAAELEGWKCVYCGEDAATCEHFEQRDGSGSLCDEETEAERNA